MHNELTINIQNREGEIATIENQGGFNIDAAIAILDLVNNIKEIFTKATYEAKQHYLSIFFERIEVRDKKIAKVIYTLLFKNLIDTHQVRITPIWLPELGLNQKLFWCSRLGSNPTKFYCLLTLRLNRSVRCHKISGAGHQSLL